MNGDMILQAGPGSPWWLHLGADLLLYLHIGGALVAIAVGAVAMFSRKGGRMHRLSGNVFFVAMLVMAGIAAGVAPFLPKGQWSNSLSAVFTIYLVATSWATVKRPAGQTGRFEFAAFLLAASMGATGLVLLVLYGATPRASAFAGVYVTCFLAGLSAAADLRVIRQGGIAGPRRTARHLWRMGLPMFVAVGSGFVGQQDELPTAVQGSPLLFAPMIAVVGATLWWLYRLRLRPRRASAAMA